jgi:hypothetical protein
MQRIEPISRFKRNQTLAERRTAERVRFDPGFALRLRDFEQLLKERHHFAFEYEIGHGPRLCLT